MTTHQTARRTYSAQELHRLRATCSQPKLREAIEKHEGEDADLVKEHVLRGSRSFAARSFRSRTSGNSLRVPSSNKENRSTVDADSGRQSSEQESSLNIDPVLGEISANNQVLRAALLKYGTSPTPSLKKKKAEAIVKAHGSPQHVRVTAGGRIVPSEQSPLCHPRYGYSAIKTNGGLIKFAPNHPMGKAQWTQATQNGFVAQDVNGQLCQIVNGTILPLNEVDGALRLFIPAPNLNITSRTSSLAQSGPGHLGNSDHSRRALSQSKPALTTDPPLPAQTNALELEYSKLEHELRELDKTEVLHGRTMGKVAKDALVTKRRELVVSLDDIRKAIKSIKSIPAARTPLSSRDVQSQYSASPTKGRLSAFMQPRAPPGHETDIPPYGPFFGLSQPAPYQGNYSYPDTSNNSFNDAGFGFSQPPLFVPPPPFDGSMAAPFAAFNNANANNLARAEPTAAATMSQLDAAQLEVQLPQTDGAASISDLRKPTSPGRSHAINIKVPEPKSAWASKSNLNPMSPAYKPGNGILRASGNSQQAVQKPVKDRVPTPLSPLHELKPVTRPSKPTNTSDNTISPTKKSPHVHSSSVSSFETADFFPRNTREYSTRKHNYPEQSEDKENVSPEQSAYDADGSTGAHDQQARAPIITNTSSDGYNTPAAPPGTPARHHDSDKISTSIRNNASTSEHSARDFDMRALPDRQAHNLSPKARRQDYLFVYENPGQLPSLPSSSPNKADTSQQERQTSSSAVQVVDFSHASVAWLQGYRAGLAREPVGPDQTGETLDGYCAGLLKSKSSATLGPSTGSPVKLATRRPSPCIIQSRSSSRLQDLDRREALPPSSPLEHHVQSMDTLKEAVFAPANEDAILSPGLNGPHVDEHTFNLGSWEKTHPPATADVTPAHLPEDVNSGYPFPHRIAPMNRRQGVMSELETVQQRVFTPMHVASLQSVPDSDAVSELSADEASHHITSLDQAISSLHVNKREASNALPGATMGVQSNVHHQWPGPRILSNQLEWKTNSSLAQVGGFPSPTFGTAQFDGQSAPQSYFVDSKREVADSEDYTGMPPTQRQASIMSNPTMHTHSRFKESSLDGISNPPNSPQITSPPMSPSALTGDRPRSGGKKRDSPGKPVSPSKVKFENLAEKVGIKVSTGGKKEDGGSPNTPPGKRRWRDVWRGGRKDLSKDDSAPEKTV